MAIEGTAFHVSGEADDAAVCELYGIDAAALAERRTFSPHLAQWIATRADGSPAGILVATRRPDARVFFHHRLADRTCLEPLVAAAMGALAAGGPLGDTAHITIDAESTHDPSAAASRATLERLGWRAELAGGSFEVPFEPALQALDSLRPPARRAPIRIVTSAEVDLDALFRLDTQLRGATPGTDGWVGVRELFDAEHQPPQLDPSGYAVAIDTGAEQLIGLCRMWHNPVRNPALGLLGVLPQHRTGGVAIALLRAALAGAARWGWPTFSTHTARPGLRRRMLGLGAVETSRYVRYVSPAPAC